jgi:hypothetical protein
MDERHLAIVIVIIATKILGRQSKGCGKDFTQGSAAARRRNPKADATTAAAAASATPTNRSNSSHKAQGSAASLDGEAEVVQGRRGRRGKTEGTISKDGQISAEEISTTTTTTTTFKYFLVRILLMSVCLSVSVSQAQMDTTFPTQFTIFDEIGSMASGMAHIHVAIPLNLSTFAGQALVLEDYLSKLSRAVGEDDEQTKIFMQSIREISKFALTRLQRIKAAITHLDVILPVDGDLTQQRQRRMTDALDADIYESIDTQYYLDARVATPIHINDLIISPTILREKFVTRWRHQLHHLQLSHNTSVKFHEQGRSRVRRQVSNKALSDIPTRDIPWFKAGKPWPTRDRQRLDLNFLISQLEQQIKSAKDFQAEIRNESNYLLNENSKLRQALGLEAVKPKSISQMHDEQIEILLNKALSGINDNDLAEYLRLRRNPTQDELRKPDISLDTKRFVHDLMVNRKYFEQWDNLKNFTHSPKIELNVTRVKRELKLDTNNHWIAKHPSVWDNLNLDDKDRRYYFLKNQYFYLQTRLSNLTLTTMMMMRNFSGIEQAHSKLSTIWSSKNMIQPEGFYTLDEILKQSPQSTLLQEHDHSRVKRVAPLVVFAAISGVLGTFLGMYNAWEISVLKNRLNEVSKNHNLLVQVTKKQEEQIHKITENMNAICSLIKLMVQHNPALISAQISAQLDLFQSRLTRATNAVQQLQHRRLAVDLLDSVQLDEMHKAIKAVAEQRGYTLLPERLSDYFQLEASYLRQGKDILIMLHVPCILHDQMLTIYRYIPFPYPLPNKIVSDPTTIQERISDTTITHSKTVGKEDPLEAIDALIIIPEAEMIAVGRERKFKILSQGDLAACIKRNRVFLCEKHQVLHTNLASSCLGSIFDRNEIGVKENCKLERKRLRETVYQLSATDHILFTPHPYTTEIICKNGSHFPLYLSQTTKIHIPEECKVTLNSHSIQSDYNIRISPEPLNVPWQWNPLSLPADLLLDAAMIDGKINALTQNLTSLFNETAVKTDFQQMINAQFSSPSAFPWFIWASIFASVIALLLLMFWYCYNSHQMHRYQNPPQSGPSVQLIQMPQPQAPPQELQKPGYHLPPQYNL